MRRVIAAAAGTVAGLILLLSFKTRPTTPANARLGVEPTTTTTGDGSDAATGPAVTPPASSTTTAPTAVSGTKTVTGAVAETRYGPVEVQITVTNGQLTAVNALEYPTARSRDIEINSYAIPRLDQEAVAAKGANIDMISGATYTSDGFVTSLQSALNKAGLA